MVFKRAIHTHIKTSSLFTKCEIGKAKKICASKCFFLHGKHLPITNVMTGINSSKMIHIILQIFDFCLRLNNFLFAILLKTDTVQTCVRLQTFTYYNNKSAVKGFQ